MYIDRYILCITLQSSAEKKIARPWKLPICISKNLRWLNERVERALRQGMTHDLFHVFTIFKCDYNVYVAIIIYLVEVV